MGNFSRLEFAVDAQMGIENERINLYAAVPKYQKLMLI
jgi:hypothetical protein